MHFKTAQISVCEDLCLEAQTTFIMAIWTNCRQYSDTRQDIFNLLSQYYIWKVIEQKSYYIYAILTSTTHVISHFVVSFCYLSRDLINWLVWPDL